MKNSDYSRRDFLQAIGAGVGIGVLGSLGLKRWQSLGKISVVHAARPLLGTVFSITIHHPDETLALGALEAAFNEVHKVDKVMSLHRPDSDLCRMNQTAGKEEVAVDPSLCSILTTAKEISVMTGGVYDVTCLPVLRRFGFYDFTSESKTYPTDREIYTLLESVGSTHLSIDASRSRVGLTKRGASADLGSIGKGFAVDRAAEALKKQGIESALVDAGGNMVALGRPLDSGETWKVAIRNPARQNSHFEILSLKDEAVATSGNYENNHMLGGKTVGHLLNALNGRPAEGQTASASASATVVADNATLADAFSTSAFLLGPDKARRVLKTATRFYFHGFQG